MRKAILLIFLLSVINNFCYCANSFNMKNAIEIIEKETNTYAGENISYENRVKNAEIYVFGNSKQGNLEERIISLAKVLGITGLINNTHKKQEERIYEIENNEKSNYPAIDKMEREIFGTTYEKENIYKRLDRLEKKAFGQISSNSLNDRVNNLQEKFNKNYKVNNHSYNEDEYAYYSPKDYTSDLNKMEKKFFKKSYEGEDLSKRLSRIETKLFSQSFEHEDEQTRLERIDAVKKAAKSGTEYKINRFAKYAVTGAQIGGILLLILAMIL